MLAYERLIAEGFLDTRPPAGTFVASPPSWSRAETLERPTPCENLAFSFPDQEPCVGSPDPSLFPASRWRSLMRAGLDRMGTQRACEHPAGSPALREAIAGWLSTSRGLAVSEDQILLLRGRQQALNVAAHLARAAFSGAGLGRIAGDGVGRSGNGVARIAGDGVGRIAGRGMARIVVDLATLGRPHARRRARRSGAGPGRRGRSCASTPPQGEAALIHVTPEHQRPLGVALSHDRRRAILAWASRSGALVLEEDCEGELRYGDMSAPSLMAPDTAERVILIGGSAFRWGRGWTWPTWCCRGS